MLHDLENLISDGYISRKKHSSKDIHILNYTPKTQYDRVWNETTKACRGLILDSNGDFVARPFPKFFNFEEVLDEATQLYANASSVDIYEKMDGSLGVCFFHDGSWEIATRGSFESDQSVRANSMLASKYSSVLKNLNPDYTYLMEIIYPENKIVVNYGNEQSLTLLAVINKNSGVEDVSLDSAGFPVCVQYNGLNGASLADLGQLNYANKEGFVVRLNNSYRFKIKFEDYKRIHRTVFGLSSKVIWDSLRFKTEIDLSDVPDETFNWVKGVKSDLRTKFEVIESESRRDFESIKHLPRKEFAMEALKSKNSRVLFSLLDNKDFSDYIWKIIEPAYYTERACEDE